MKNYLLKILRPVMVAGVMKKVGEAIELAEHEAIKLVEGGKAEFAALEEKLEEKVEHVLGIGDGVEAATTVSGAAAPAADAAALSGATEPEPAAPAADEPAATVSGAAAPAADAPATNEEPAQ